MLLTAARVHTGHELVSPGYVVVDGDKISAAGTYDPSLGTPDLDLGDATIAPGYVDAHNHGGGGVSFVEDAELAAATHRMFGTTTVIASTVTQDLDTLTAQLAKLRPYVASGLLAGVHLEGPWMSEAYHGAHPVPLLRDPDPDEVARIVDAAGGIVKQVTMAVERPGGVEAVKALAARGVVTAIGHTNATYPQAKAAIDAGATGATHLFNAMRPLRHRDPGPVVALLADPRVWCEIIVDGAHIDPVLIAYVFSINPDRTVLVTDAMAAAGAADGDYDLGELKVEVRGGVARVAGTPTIAGSTLTLSAAVRNAVAYGVDPYIAIRAATLLPARYMSLEGVGELTPGANADLVVLDDSYDVTRVMWRGSWFHERTP